MARPNILPSNRIDLLHRVAALPPDAILVTAEAAAYSGIGVSTWERMRAAKETPPAIFLTKRTLGYRKRDLDAWLTSRSETQAA